MSRVVSQALATVSTFAARRFLPAVMPVRQLSATSSANGGAVLRRIAERLGAIPTKDFTPQRFAQEVEALHRSAQGVHGRRTPFPFVSDTGSGILPRVLAIKAYKNSVLATRGFDQDLIDQEADAIKRVFLEPGLTELERRAKFSAVRVFFTSSTTQANKVAITSVGNVNKDKGEIALASEHSHVFGFEVGQPAEKVSPKDKVTGKLTVEDLEAATADYAEIGKRVKIIHLDQPTNGDYFYREDEIKAITTWAHSKGIPVSMDIERLVNFLPKAEYDSYYDLTAKCGVDVVSFGMQKNGGARSSSVVVLDQTYISEPTHIDQRVAAFFRLIGDVTNNRTVVTAGWSHILRDKTYQESAERANTNSSRIADVLSGFDFFINTQGNESRDVKGEDLMQNYPLTTNMIFAKLPRDFVNIFNQTTDVLRHPYIKLSPDRHGVTRIVTAHDVTDSETDNFIFCLNKAYEVYQAVHEGKNVESCLAKLREEAPQSMVANSVVDEDSLSRDELKSAFQMMVEKMMESIAMQPGALINRKFTSEEVPLDLSVLMEIFAKNAEGYHPPYGDDVVTLESKSILRGVFEAPAADATPVVLTSSKSQAVTCVMQFLKATDESVVLVSEGSANEHRKFGRSVKPLELSGEYKEADKLDPRGVEALLSFHNSNRGKHVPLITGVMIQQPTSSGHLYTPQEIRNISVIAHRFGVPVIMNAIGLSYSLARDNAEYKEYTTKCGVDVCTIGLQGLGGSLSSAVMVLNSKFLPYQSDDNSYLQVMLDRTVKENGGKQSDSSTLAIGWYEMFENDRWRENAARANANVAKIISFVREFQFDGKPLELENLNPRHNILAMKLPKDFVQALNERGYEFKLGRDGDVRCRIPYHLSDKEIEKFQRDFKEAHQEYSKQKKPRSSFSLRERGAGVVKKLQRAVSDSVRSSD